MILELELSETQETITFVAPHWGDIVEGGENQEERVSHLQFKCKLWGWVTSSRSESPTECWEKSQAWRCRGRAPSSDMRHSPSWGTRLTTPTCDAWREITGQNNNYHSRSTITTHRINSKAHLGGSQPNAAEKPTETTCRGVRIKVLSSCACTTILSF